MRPTVQDFQFNPYKVILCYDTPGYQKQIKTKITSFDI
jgi:hypothetical protein